MARRKFAGPKVDIYVGPESKHYHLPKDILCYYSTYFDRCFNGGFKEAKHQKLSLPEDRPEDFQLLLDYIFINGEGPLEPKGDSEQQMKYCIEFIEYAGEYDLVGAVQVISGALKRLLEACFRESEANLLLKPQHIETIYRVLPEGHELRALVAVMGLKFSLVDGLFAEQERNVEGFAAEMLNQLREHKTQRNFRQVQGFCNGLEHTF